MSPLWILLTRRNFKNTMDEQENKTAELSSHTHRPIADYKMTHPPVTVCPNHQLFKCVRCTQRALEQISRTVTSTTASKTDLNKCLLAQYESQLHVGKVKLSCPSYLGMSLLLNSAATIYNFTYGGVSQYIACRDIQCVHVSNNNVSALKAIMRTIQEKNTKNITCWVWTVKLQKKKPKIPYTGFKPLTFMFKDMFAVSVLPFINLE